MRGGLFNARVAELVDALDLGSSGPAPWEFDSPLSHHLPHTNRRSYKKSTPLTADTYMHFNVIRSGYPYIFPEQCKSSFLFPCTGMSVTQTSVSLNMQIMTL